MCIGAALLALGSLARAAPRSSGRPSPLPAPTPAEERLRTFERCQDPAWGAAPPCLIEIHCLPATDSPPVMQELKAKSFSIVVALRVHNETRLCLPYRQMRR